MSAASAVPGDAASSAAVAAAKAAAVSTSSSAVADEGGATTKLLFARRCVPGVVWKVAEAALEGEGLHTTENGVAVASAPRVTMSVRGVTM
jgi:hypothetical protein